MIEYDDFLRVIALSAEAAKAWIGGAYARQEPLDLGPADPERYKVGARVWGFRSPAKTGDFTTRGGQA